MVYDPYGPEQDDPRARGGATGTLPAAAFGAPAVKRAADVGTFSLDKAKLTEGAKSLLVGGEGARRVGYPADPAVAKAQYIQSLKDRGQDIMYGAVNPETGTRPGIAAALEARPAAASMPAAAPAAAAAPVAPVAAATTAVAAQAQPAVNTPAADETVPPPVTTAASFDYEGDSGRWSPKTMAIMKQLGEGAQYKLNNNDLLYITNQPKFFDKATGTFTEDGRLYAELRGMENEQERAATNAANPIGRRQMVNEATRSLPRGGVMYSRGGVVPGSQEAQTANSKAIAEAEAGALAKADAMVNKTLPMSARQAELAKRFDVDRSRQNEYDKAAQQHSYAKELWKLGADERETFKNAEFMFRQMQIDHEAALAEAKNATDVMRINKEFEVHKQNLMQNESQFQRSLTQAAALSKDANTTNVTVANAYASATKAAAESNASAGKKSDAERDSIMAKNLGETVESMFAGEPKTPDLPARKIAVYNQLYQVGSARAYAEERKGYVAQENGKYVIVTKSDKGNYFSAPAPEFKPLTYIPPPPRAK